MYVREEFDKRFTTIIEHDLDNNYIFILDWLNKNSIGNVQVKILVSEKIQNEWVILPNGNNRAFIAFENPDDAIVFKIKFSGSITSG